MEELFKPQMFAGQHPGLPGVPVSGLQQGPLQQPRGKGHHLRAFCVSILDPRTGENMVTWSHIETTAFMVEMDDELPIGRL